MDFFERFEKRLERLPVPAPSASPAVLQPHGSAPVSKYTGHVPDSMDEIPAADRAEARERRRFLALTDLLQQERRVSAKIAVTLVAAAHADEFPILIQGGQGGASQLTYSNYRNWRQILSNARKSGSVDDALEVRLLVRRYSRGERGSTADPRFIELFRKIWLNRNQPSLPVAYRLACEAWRQIDQTVPVPAIGVVRGEVKRIPKEIVIRAREGETAWKNQCCDYITRDWSDIAPGDFAIGDSRTFDTRVRVWNNESRKWMAVRPTIAALMDASSWKMVAYWITTDPVNSDTLISTLALWCRQTGGIPPCMCYFDNGKDYNAAGFSKPLEIKGGYQHSIFRELGIGIKNATAYNGRAKTVEREFRDMMENFDKLFLDYLGSDPSQRSDASSYYDAHPDGLPSLAAFCQVFAAWLDKYNSTQKNGRIHMGKSPDEIWNSRTPDQSRRRTESELAEAFLRPVGLRQVLRGPAIQLDGEFYITDDVGFGETVLVKRSSWDPTFIALYTPDGKRLGIARTRAAIRAIAAGTEDETALSELIRRQSAQNKAARTMLHDLTGGTYGAAPLEILLTAGSSAEFKASGRMHLVKGGTHDFRLVEAGGMKSLEPAPEIAAAATEICANLTAHTEKDDSNEPDQIREMALNILCGEEPEEQHITSLPEIDGDEINEEKKNERTQIPDLD